jgi:hypothetical protein
MPFYSTDREVNCLPLINIFQFGRELLQSLYNLHLAGSNYYSIVLIFGIMCNYHLLNINCECCFHTKWIIVLAMKKEISCAFTAFWKSIRGFATLLVELMFVSAKLELVAGISFLGFFLAIPTIPLLHFA